MNKDKVTTIAGAIAGLSQLAIGAGMHVGHFAGTDFLHLATAVSIAVIGWVTGKQVIAQ